MFKGLGFRDRAGNQPEGDTGAPHACEHAADDRSVIISVDDKTVNLGEEVAYRNHPTQGRRAAVCEANDLEAPSTALVHLLKLDPSSIVILGRLRCRGRLGLGRRWLRWGGFVGSGLGSAAGGLLVAPKVRGQWLLHFLRLTGCYGAGGCDLGLEVWDLRLILRHVQDAAARWLLLGVFTDLGCR